jgi:spermidine/putrescine transport system permease protein
LTARGARSHIVGRWRGRAATTLFLLPTSAWYFLLLIVPVGILLIFSFGTRAPEGGYAGGLTLDNYLHLPTRAGAFTNTLGMAVGGTILCLLVGYPLAYYLASRAGAKKTLLLVLVIVPFWTSFLIRTYAWLTILGSTGIPAVLERLGLGKVVLLNTPLAVMIGIVYNYLPLMVFPLYVSLERLDKRLLEASKDLGAGRWRTFAQVTLPLTLPGVLSGIILVFIPIMGEYLIPSLLGGGVVFFVGNALVDAFLQSRNWPFGSAMAISLILVVLVAVALYLRIGSRGQVQRDIPLV